MQSLISQEKHHHCQTLIEIFDDCFFEQYNTRLILGQDEPFYQAANESCHYHSVIFAHGFFSSALHECAHWLIAGKKRRFLDDYGYWYIPDGRNANEQQEFQRVEAKPQALEWILCQAANFPFQPSIDNLGGVEVNRKEFLTAIYQEVIHYCKKGLPLRAKSLFNALSHFYRGLSELHLAPFTRQYEEQMFKLTQSEEELCHI